MSGAYSPRGNVQVVNVRGVIVRRVNVHPPFLCYSRDEVSHMFALARFVVTMTNNRRERENNKKEPQME